MATDRQESLLFKLRSGNPDVRKVLKYCVRMQDFSVLLSVRLESWEALSGLALKKEINSLIYGWHV